MFYPQEVIEQVLEANNIVDVISQYVRLTKRGSTYFGLCPFHNEKTPSFSVTDNGDRKMFYCFGCHSGGNVMTFLMKYENYTYSEALNVLAERAGITLPKPQYSKEDSAKYQLKEQVLEVYKEAAVYYYHLLKTEHGRQAYDYLKKRQLSDETILNYGLGYSDKYRDDLYRYIKSKGYSDEVLKATGLFSIKENDIHDYFWNRVMFPIMDVRNRVIAFGGRVMGDGEPKYLNSPETIAFEKSKTLFGLNVAKKHKGNELILCEGYMDVISLHQAGFTNAVASLGTSLTTGHVNILKRYTENVVISYDADGAGRNAALRAIPMLRSQGINTKVINLKPYKDPDELIKAEGADTYKERLRTARNSFLFEIDVLKESFDLNDPDGRTKFQTQTARRLSEFTDEIERDSYIQTVSREFDIDYKMLRDRTIRFALSADNKPVRQPENPSFKPKEKEKGKTAISESMKAVLSYLAEVPSSYNKIKGIIDAADFDAEPYSAIASLLFAQLESGRANIAAIIGAFPDESEQEKAAEILSPTEKTEDADILKKNINQCIINIKTNSIERQISEETDILKALSLKKQQEKLKQLNII